MKRPTIKKRNLRSFFRNKPILSRVMCAGFILFSPLIGTYYLWKEYGHEVIDEIVYSFKMIIGKWED